MTSKAPCRLYLITPPALPDLDAFAADLEAALGAGDVGALQIRLKPAGDDQVRAAVRRLLPVAHAHGVAVILNDRPDLAAELGCDGVHVGDEDPAVDAARRILGPDAMIGATCRDSRHAAMEAAEAGADYVAFGAFFPTETKDTTARPRAGDPDHLAGDHGHSLRGHRRDHRGQRPAPDRGGRGLPGGERGGVAPPGRSSRSRAALQRLMG